MIHPGMIAMSHAAEVARPPMLAGPRWLGRHLRLADLYYLRVSRNLVELVADHRSCPKVLDVCDSVALTQRRAFEYAGGFRGGKWIDALDLYRARRTEARLPGLFDRLTTVGGVDTAGIIRPSGIGANVHTVPNGVSEAYLAPMPPPPHRPRRALFSADGAVGVPRLCDVDFLRA
jgi:hypothetical protein